MNNKLKKCNECCSSCFFLCAATLNGIPKGYEPLCLHLSAHLRHALLKGYYSNGIVPQELCSAQEWFRDENNISEENSLNYLPDANRTTGCRLKCYKGIWDSSNDANCSIKDIITQDRQKEECFFANHTNSTLYWPKGIELSNLQREAKRNALTLQHSHQLNTILCCATMVAALIPAIVQLWCHYYPSGTAIDISGLSMKNIVLQVEQPSKSGEYSSEHSRNGHIKYPESQPLVAEEKTEESISGTPINVPVPQSQPHNP